MGRDGAVEVVGNRWVSLGSSFVLGESWVCLCSGPGQRKTKPVYCAVEEYSTVRWRGGEKEI